MKLTFLLFDFFLSIRVGGHWSECAAENFFRSMNVSIPVCASDERSVQILLWWGGRAGPGLGELIVWWGGRAGPGFQSLGVS